MENLVNMTNWFILVNVDFCFLKIEEKLITSFLGLGVTGSQTVHICFCICVQINDCGI